MSMPTAKAHILTSIRENLGVSKPHDELWSKHHHATPIQPNDGPLRSPSIDELLQLFTENLKAVGGQVSVVNDLSGATKAVQEIVNNTRPSRVAISDSRLVRDVVGDVKTDAEILRSASAHELFTCDIGITSAQYAIAETGTLVLNSEKEYARLTSLVPDIHICVLELRPMCQNMAEVLDHMRHDLSPAVTFITGPSRTSDIELTLAIGVHGPRELHVILIDDRLERDKKLVDGDLESTADGRTGG